MRISLRSALLLSLVAVAVVSLAAQDATLRYRWNKGEALKYRLTQETTAAMSGVPGMGEMTIVTVLQQMQTMTTTDVAADGAATVQVKFDGVKLNLDTPMGGTAYDSASATPPADPIGQMMAPMLGAIIGESITMVMDPDGAVRSVTGAGKIKAKMDQLMPPGGGAMGMNPASGIDSMFSDDAMKGSMNQGFAMMPKTALKAGDTWTSENKMPGPAGEMLFSTAFTMKGVETLDGQNVARIGFVTDIRPNGKATPAGPMTITFEKGTGDGEVLFDVKQGRVVKTTNNATLPMGMTMTMPDGQTMSLSSMTKMKMTYELVK